MSSPIQEFADNLKLIRKGRSLTQVQLAEKVGLTKQSIINYEKGLTFPTGKRLENLLDALDVTTEQLLGRELSQSTYEKRLIEACCEKATFWGESQVFQEQNKDITESEKKEFMLDYLRKFDSDKLQAAITSIYDKEILSAQHQFCSELADSVAYPEEGLSIDLMIKQDDEEE